MVSVVNVTVSSRISVPEIDPVGRTTSASPVPSVRSLIAVMDPEPISIEVAVEVPMERRPAVDLVRVLPLTVPVVVMLSAPVSIDPKFAVIDPASRAPVPVIPV